MSRLAEIIVRRRWIVIAAWVASTLFGGFAAGQLADRWFQEFSIPGQPAYEANTRAVEALGNGRIAPYVAVLRADRDITQVAGVGQAFEAAAKATPNARMSSFCTTGDEAYLSEDRRVAFAEIFAGGERSSEGVELAATREAL